MKLASTTCVVVLAASAARGTAEPATPPVITEALGVGVGHVSGGSGDDTPLVFSIHGEVGRTMLPTIQLVVGIDILARIPEPDFEEGMTKPRTQGAVVVGGRIEPLPRMSFAGAAGLGVTDYVVDVSCNFFTGCDDVTETVFGLVVGAEARFVLVRGAGRLKHVGVEAHVARAQYQDVGGVLTADVGLVFGEL